MRLCRDTSAFSLLYIRFIYNRKEQSKPFRMIFEKQR